MARFIVIEGRASESAAQRAVGVFARPAPAGLDGAPGRLCTAVVRTRADAHQVVLAALAGADLVVECRADRSVVDVMCDDLRRLGHLDHRVVDTRPVVLADDQRDLLAAIAAGGSLGSAAAALHLSRRTADRRIAAARAALGAATTAEAVVTATRIGLLDRPSR